MNLFQKKKETKKRRNKETKKQSQTKPNKARAKQSVWLEPIVSGGGGGLVLGIDSIDSVPQVYALNLLHLVGAEGPF